MFKRWTFRKCRFTKGFLFEQLANVNSPIDNNEEGTENLTFLSLEQFFKASLPIDFVEDRINLSLKDVHLKKTRFTIEVIDDEIDTCVSDVHLLKH